MAAFLEVWRGDGRDVVPLDTDRVTIGRDAENDIAVPSDTTLSAVHAVLERLGGKWSLRDVGSRNGTTVNGRRIQGERVLRSGDEILAGRIRLLFRDMSRKSETLTDPTTTAPQLTNRERDVLLALCRPVLGGNMFTDPASLREIAAELHVSDTAVKQHLNNLYRKFDILEGGERRRIRLANEAINRGAITLADLGDQAES